MTNKNKKFGSFVIQDVCIDTLGAVDQEERITSLEIAEICGKRHKHMLRDIREMEPAWVNFTGTKFGLSEYIDPTGRILPCYNLSKTESLYIITKYNNEARAKLVLRWHELEMQERNKMLIMQLQQSQQIEKMQSEVDFARIVKAQPEEISLDQFAKVLRNAGVVTGERRMREQLMKDGFLCHSRKYKYHPYQRYIEQEWFVLREEKIGKGQYRLRPYITHKGLENLLKFYCKPKVIVPHITAVQLTFGF